MQRAATSCMIAAFVAVAACNREAPPSSPPTTVATNPATAAPTPEPPDPTPSPSPPTPPKAPLDHWKLGPQHVLAGLHFGTDIETAWDAAPALRDGMQVHLEVSQYDEVARRIPELREDTSGGKGVSTTRIRMGTWPEVDGLTWELRFELERGLTMITAQFETREQIYALLGEPDLRARWEFWFDPASHTRAALTRCGPDSWADGKPTSPDTCKLELMPYQSLDDHLEHMFPGDGTWVGRPMSKLPFSAGEPWNDYTTSFAQRPLDTSLYLPLYVQPDAEGNVAGYRSAVSYTYNADAQRTYQDALAMRIEGLPESIPVGTCVEGTRAGVAVEVCHDLSQLMFTVGAWK